MVRAIRNQFTLFGSLLMKFLQIFPYMYFQNVHFSIYGYNYFNTKSKMGNGLQTL